MPYVYFLLQNNVTCCVFLEATTTVLESFPNSTGKQGPFFSSNDEIIQII